MTRAEEPEIDDCDAPTLVREVPVVPPRSIALSPDDLEPEPEPEPEPVLIAPAPDPFAAAPEVTRPSSIDIDVDDEIIDPRVFRSPLRARGALLAIALAAIAAVSIFALARDGGAEQTAERPTEGAPLVP